MSTKKITEKTKGNREEKKQNKIRLVDIAQCAEVSVASVSRVLKGASNIDDEIRNKVYAAMADLHIDEGYFSKKSSETYNFKFILLLIDDLTDTYYASLVKGIKDIANMHQYEIILGNLKYYENDYSRIRHLAQEQCLRGVIRVLSDSKSTFNESILDNSIPFVLIDNVIKNRQSHTVFCDDRGGASNAVKYLISLGHRRILYLSGDNRMNSEKARYEGYCNALDSAGIQIDTALITESITNFNKVHDCIVEKIKSNIGFTAVFCDNDMMSIAAQKALEEQGLSIPEDISLMGFNDSPLMNMISMTTCFRPEYELGRNAMLMLLDIIDGRSISEKHLMLQPTIKIRNSCRRNYRNFEDSARNITSGRTIKIGFTPPAISEFYDIIKHGAYTMMKELTDRFNVKFEFEVAAPIEHKEVNSQVQIIDNWIEKKYDAILVCSAGDFECMNPVYEKAENAGTAIYLFNMPSEILKETELKVTSVISYNNHYQAGNLVGRYAVEKLKGKGKILLIWGFPGHWSNTRKEGFMEAISLYPAIEVVGEGCGDYVQENGMKVAMELLAEHPDVDLIYSENEEMAKGAVQAIEACGLKLWDGKEGIITIGADGLKSGYESIKNGKLTATVNVGPVDQGREFIMAVFMHEALGYNVDKIINVSTTIVDESNVDAAAGYTDWALGTEYP